MFELLLPSNTMQSCPSLCQVPISVFIRICGKSCLIVAFFPEAFGGTELYDRVTFFSNAFKTSCWFNASMQLIHEMMRTIQVKPQGYLDLEQYDDGDRIENRYPVTVDFGIDTLVWYLLEDCGNGIVAPENIIAKVAVLYLNVQPNQVNRFLHQQQSVSLFSLSFTSLNASFSSFSPKTDLTFDLQFCTEYRF